ncbi:restriction endonuclease subunit S [Formosa sediminum]|uniref:Restriction endonuclease subunit S n=1 Tax=Formosa sediminum TaxID=2594004 RepID=A0A516GSE2_9FLAO|nr:restriction endonuclease subunit S [Formosa sediminum]QDO94435.1 restriction endonuclease subunit S [Formosa sediminum]
MKSNYRKIGDFIQQVNTKNADGSIELLLGVNLDKVFINSVANTIGTDMTKYKVIKKGQFGCKLMSVGRDKKLPISRLVDYEKAIISSAYYVFEVVDENILNPEYLMMWFLRPESDRYLWFQSGGDVRGRITWDDLCQLPIKVPSIEKQREIVKEYNSIINRIKLNETLNHKLEDTAQALYKHWFVDFEFPINLCHLERSREVSIESLNNIDYSKGYKSSGGKMVYNEELDMEIPEGWEDTKLSELLEVKYGKDYKHLEAGDIPLYGSGGIMGYYNKALYEKPSILIPRKGSLDNILFVDEPFWSVDTMFYTIIKEESYINYLFQFLKKIDYYSLNVGSAVPSMTTKVLNDISIILPLPKILERYENLTSKMFRIVKQNDRQNFILVELASTILSKMSKVETKTVEV